MRIARKMPNYVIQRKVDNDCYIAYNPLNKCVVACNQSLDSITAPDSGSTQELIDVGLLIEGEANQETIYADWFDGLGESERVLSVVVHTTFHCNMQCVYCYENGIKSAHMNSDTAAQVAAFIRERCDNAEFERVELCFIGGEPLLNTEVIKSILEQLQRVKTPIFTMVVTNGTLLTAQVVDDLKCYSIVDYMVTIDGLKHTHDSMRPMKNAKQSSYDTIISNLKAASNKVNIHINTNISNENEADLNALLTSLRTAGIRFNPIFSLVFKPAGTEYDACLGGSKAGKAWLNAHTTAMSHGFKFSPIPRMSTGPCPSLRKHNYVIDPNGYMYSCISAVGRDAHKQGHIATFDAKVHAITIAKRRQVILNDKACKACKYRGICGGGCCLKRETNSHCDKQLLEAGDVALMVYNTVRNDKYTSLQAEGSN